MGGGLLFLVCVDQVYTGGDVVSGKSTFIRGIFILFINVIGPGITHDSTLSVSVSFEKKQSTFKYGIQHQNQFNYDPVIGIHT